MEGPQGTSPVIISLGGNAIIRQGQSGTIVEQMENAAEACSLIAAMSTYGAPLIVTHGNGPVVGNIVIRNEAARDIIPPMPLFMADAESVGGVGFMLQQIIYNHLRKIKSDRDVATIITQVVVDTGDPAFHDPSKPIGPFYSELEARSLAGARGWVMKEDSKRGFRRVVPSPKPRRIVEAAVIERLVADGVIVIAAGGGGVPVAEDASGMLRGVDAVIDKDHSSALLGIEVKARLFIDLTSVETVFLDYNKPGQKPIDEMSVADAERYLGEGHFAEGSMRPKIEAAIEFLRGGGAEVVITSPARALDALKGRAGTRIYP